MRRGSLKKLLNLRNMQRGCTVEPDETILLPTSLQNSVGIGEARSAIKAEADSLCVYRQRRDAVGGTLCGAIADDKEVEIVIDEFVRGREALAHR